MVCSNDGDTNFFAIIISLARRFISAIFVHNLPRQHISNDDRPNKRKWFYTKKARSRWYSVEIKTDANIIDDLALLTNAYAQAESQLHNLKQAAWDMDLLMKANKTDYMCFKQKWAISTLRDRPLRLVNQFTYRSSNISSTVNNFKRRCSLLSTDYRLYGSLICAIK